jgi:hypothetical protein
MRTIREHESARPLAGDDGGITMLGEVNFHSRAQWNTWAGYSVLAASLIAAFAILASA